MKNLTGDIPTEELKGCVDSYISHCVKSVQIRSFFWSVFSCIRTKYGKISSSGPNTEKYGPEKTPYWDTLHAVSLINTFIERSYFPNQLKLVV